MYTLYILEYIYIHTHYRLYRRKLDYVPREKIIIPLYFLINVLLWVIKWVSIWEHVVKGKEIEELWKMLVFSLVSDAVRESTLKRQYYEWQREMEQESQYLPISTYLNIHYTHLLHIWYIWYLWYIQLWLYIQEHSS